MSFQRLKTWKQSHAPDFEAKKNRILHLYGLMDGTHDVEPGDPEVVFCVDEFGPLNLQPHPRRHWAVQGGGRAQPRRRRRVTYTRPHGVRHPLAAYDLSRDRLYGHIKPRKRRGEFLLDGTDHASHHAQASMICRYIAWRNRIAQDRRFREIVNRAKVA